MRNLFALFFFTIISLFCAQTLEAKGPKEVEFKFASSAVLKDDSYAFLTSIHAKLEFLDSPFLEIGRDGMKPEDEAVVIEHKPCGDNIFDVFLVIRDTNEEIMIGRVKVDKKNLEEAKKRGYAFIEGMQDNKATLLKSKNYTKSSNSGFGCGITGCGFGRVKGQNVLVQFKTSFGESFCYNKGILDDKPKYFKGSCKQ